MLYEYEKKVMDYLEKVAPINTDCCKKERAVSAVVIEENHICNFNSRNISANTTPGFLPSCKNNGCIREKMAPGEKAYLCNIVHAEVEAILTLVGKPDIRLPLFNYILFTTLFPCNSCAMIIIRCGIKKVYYRHEYNNEYFDKVMNNFNQAGIVCKKM
jgi:deoxycytidylate deaminase